MTSCDHHTMTTWNHDMGSVHHDNMTSWQHDIMTTWQHDIMTSFYLYTMTTLHHDIMIPYHHKTKGPWHYDIMTSLHNDNMTSSHLETITPKHQDIMTWWQRAGAWHHCEETGHPIGPASNIFKNIQSVKHMWTLSLFQEPRNWSRKSRNTTPRLQFLMEKESMKCSVGKRNSSLENNQKKLKTQTQWVYEQLIVLHNNSQKKQLNFSQQQQQLWFI